MMKSTTLRRSGVSARGVIEISTWLEASTGTLVSWLTGIGSSFTLRRRAYSRASIQAGPLQASPWPDVFSISQGALASTPTLSAPAFRMASMRGLAPGATVATCATAPAAERIDAAPASVSNALLIAPDFMNPSSCVCDVSYRSGDEGAMRGGGRSSAGSAQFWFGTIGYQPGRPGSRS